MALPHQDGEGEGGHCVKVRKGDAVSVYGSSNKGGMLCLCVGPIREVLPTTFKPLIAWNSTALERDVERCMHAVTPAGVLMALQVLGAARGMLYLHDSRPPIIHRDLKSPNLLVDDAGRVKVRAMRGTRLGPHPHGHCIPPP